MPDPRRRMRLPSILVLALLAAVVLVSAASGATPRWRAWLCMPGAPDDWCSVDLTTTVFAANGSHRNAAVPVATSPPIDCFYLYPTVADEMRPNATLKVHPEERETAITQAARFSQVCRVYAPLFRQVTDHAGETVLGVHIASGNYALEYTDIRAAWHDYLAHYNDGRGVVLIGHSDGSFLFEQLLKEEYRSFRKVFVGAILLGGNVLVDRQDRYVGIPACRSATRTGCIVAYSSWDHTPPRGASMESIDRTGQHVLCVNPAAPGSSAATPITPIFAGINPEGIVPYYSKYVAYHWGELPDLYTARCVRQGSRSWLLVTRIHHAGDHRPTVQEELGPERGLHAADVNIALANLVTLAGSWSRTWAATH